MNPTSNSAVSETPKIQRTGEPRQLTIGPVGIVPSLPDNRELWAAVNAVEFTQRGAGRTAVYRAVAYYAALTEQRTCYAAVATIATRARMGTTATRAQLRALEKSGHIAADCGRSKGRKGTAYRLIGAVPQPNGKPSPTQR